MLFAACCAPQALRAQEAGDADNPFDAAAPAAEEPAAGEPADMEPAPDEAAAPDEAPEGEAAAPKPADAAAPAPSAALQDPAVQAVLESRGQTPFDLLRGIGVLADLGHADLAQPLVDRLTKQQLDQAQKAALASRFPSAFLMKLARHPIVGKQLGPFIDDLFESAQAFRRDPTRLGGLTAQLSDADERQRARAIQALLSAGDAAVTPLVAVLADPARAKEHALAKRILGRLGGLAVGPLLGVLESSDAALKTQVAEVLGTIRARQAIGPLLGILVSPQSTPPLRMAAATALQQTTGRTPAPGEAMQMLEDAVVRGLEQSRDETGDGPPTLEVWHWDAKQQASLPLLYNQTGAGLAHTVRRAYELYAVDPQSAERRRLYLTALLQSARLAAGLDQPLPKEPGSAAATATGFGPHAIEDVLAFAMQADYIPAATAAAEILGDIGTLDLLARGGATPGTLARAANHADRRLRFAATAAIVRLDPREPFAGSSYVTEGLGFFAASYGTPKILIAHPLSAEGGKLAGLAAALGYEGDVATNGRQAYELAVQSPDYELVLIHSAIQRPAADELLAQLRRDRRTARLPVGFMAPLDDMTRVEDFARRAGRAEAFLQPQNEPEMRLFVGDLLARAGRSHVSVAERNAQAQSALDWLVALAHKEQRVFDIRQLEPAIVPLVYVPQLAGRAVELLGSTGTDHAQRTLVTLADSASQPLPLRKAAVAALARSIRAHGILLTSDEIRRQYDIYNANAGRQPETHEVLGLVLDTIERKGAPPAVQ